MNTAPKRIEIEELPEGWIEINLNAAVESMKNGLYKPANEYAEHGVACLRMYNIDGGRIIWKNIKRMLLASDEVNEYHLAPGDLLVNRVNSRELVGKTAVFPEGLEPCVYESKNIRVRLLSKLVNSDFVNYQLLLFGQHYFNYNSQQVVGMASISQPQIGDFPLLLPPRIEQDRIVSKVQATLAKVEKSNSHIANVAKTLKRFRQAALAAACSGRLTEDWRSNQCDLTPVSQSLDRIKHLRRETSTRNHRTDKKYLPPKELETDSLSALPNGWEYVSSDTLFSFVTSGSRGWAQYYADAGPIFVRIGNLDHGSIELDLSDVQRVRPPEGMEQKRTAVREGDILVSITADVGMVGLVPPALGQAHINQHIALARPVDPWYSRYLAWYLASDDAQAQFLALQRGATKVGLGLEDIKSVAIPFPPQEEQREIVRRLESLLRIADEIQTRVAAASRYSEKLTQSVLAKAFRGELAPTEAELARREGREYEPASALLERIKKEMASLDSGEALRSKRATSRGSKRSTVSA